MAYCVKQKRNQGAWTSNDAIYYTGPQLGAAAARPEAGYLCRHILTGYSYGTPWVGRRSPEDFASSRDRHTPVEPLTEEVT